MKRLHGMEGVRPRRGEVVYLGPLLDPLHTTFDDIPEWHALGGYCSKCERTGWVQRWDLSQKWGKGAYLSSLSSRLRCLRCGNREGNKWILGQLPR